MANGQTSLEEHCCTNVCATCSSGGVWRRIALYFELEPRSSRGYWSSCDLVLSRLTNACLNSYPYALAIISCLLLFRLMESSRWQFTILKLPKILENISARVWRMMGVRWRSLIILRSAVRKSVIVVGIYTFLTVLWIVLCGGLQVNEGNTYAVVWLNA